MINLAIAILGCLIISFVVFGGGQVFIPFFKILIVDFMNVDSSLWESALTLANATPGVFSTKLAFITGFLAANGQWWGYLAMFITYACFVIVPMIIMMFAMKGLKKIQKNQFWITINKLIKPVVTGILFALCIQLFLSATMPFVIFNDVNKYVGYEPSTFFSDWRLYALIAFVPCSIASVLWILHKYKINIIWLILTNISIAMLIFQPWLYG